MCPKSYDEANEDVNVSGGFPRTFQKALEPSKQFNYQENEDVSPEPAKKIWNVPKKLNYEENKQGQKKQTCSWNLL